MLFGIKKTGVCQLKSMKLSGFNPVRFDILLGFKIKTCKKRNLQ